MPPAQDLLAILSWRPVSCAFASLIILSKAVFNSLYRFVRTLQRWLSQALRNHAGQHDSRRAQQPLSNRVTNKSWVT